MSTEPKKIPPLPYPLTRRTRLSIMLSLITAFFVIAPLLIMYTRGYTYDFPTGQVIHGGALSIETEPSGATLFINGIQMETHSPLRLSNILPGNYHIKIERPGFFSWEKDMSIVSNQTTYLHDIDLFEQKKPEQILVTTKNIEKIFPAHNNDFFLFSTHENENYELSLFHAKTQKENFLTRVLSTSTPEVEWSENGDTLRIASTVQNQNNVLLLNPLSPTLIQTASTVSKTKPHYQWQEGRFGTALIYQNKNVLELMDLNSTQELFPLTTSTVTWFVGIDKTLWEYANNRVTHRYADGKEIFSQPVSHPLEKFIDINESRLIGTNGKNITVYQFGANSFLDEQSLPVSHTTFYPEQNYYIAWQDGELWTILPNGTANLMNRFSDTIEDVVPLTPLGTLLIVTPTKLFTFHPRYSLTHELLNAEHIESVSVVKKRRELYVLGMIDGVRGVWRLKY